MNLSRVSAILVAIWVLTSWWIIVNPISNVLPVATNHAEAIDFLFKFMTVASIAIFLIVEGFLLYFCLKYRSRPGESRDALGSDIHGNTRLEIVWSVIPTIFLVVLTAISAKVYADIIAPHADSYNINVTASQFQFECQHPTYGNIAEFDTCHMPTGGQVTLHLQATDVIHSFWVPAFRVKQDAVPGHPTVMHFIPTRVGTYRLICAEFCGVGHPQMFGHVIVMKPTDFVAWAKQQQSQATGAIGQVSFKKDVEAIFTAHCAVCHISIKLGGLNLGSYSGLLAGGSVVPGPIVKPGDTAHSVLWQIIQPGTGQPGGNRMPLGGPYLSQHEIDTITAWIKQGAKNN
jgi:cytochrome c oxidase subunit 2